MSRYDARFWRQVPSGGFSSRAVPAAACASGDEHTRATPSGVAPSSGASMTFNGRSTALARSAERVDRAPPRLALVEISPTSPPHGSFRPRGSGCDLFDGLREGRDASPSRGLALSQLLTIRLSALYQPALKTLTRPVTQYR